MISTIDTPVIRCATCQRSYNSAVVNGRFKGDCPHCLVLFMAEGKEEDAMNLDAGTVVGRARVVRKLGRGGMGTVYLAEHLGFGTTVCVKILDRELARDAEYVARFHIEAKLCGKFQHENIVTVLDTGVDRDLVWLIMEHFDGTPVPTPLPQDQAVAVIVKTCDALEYAHARGVVHRDIKPSNVLVDKQGRVKVVDFGLAKILGKGAPDLTRSQTVLGTTRYAAPEQTNAFRVDHRADIFAVGMLFCEMLTGAPPSGDPMVKADPELRAIINKATMQGPGDRYQDIVDLKSAVVERMKILSPPPAVETTDEKPKRILKTATSPLAAKPDSALAYWGFRVMLAALGPGAWRVFLYRSNDRALINGSSGVWVVFTVAAFWLAATALSDIKKSRGELAGDTWAWIAIIGAILQFVIAAALFLFA